MKKILFALIMVVFISACAPLNENTTYARSDVGQSSSVLIGTIKSIKAVQVQGTSGVGTLGGAIAGGAAGSMIGGNTAVHVIGAVGGALIGGAVGGATEEAITSGEAVEFIVKTTSGRLMSIVQTNELGLRVGDRVYITDIGGKMRLQLDN